MLRSALAALALSSVLLLPPAGPLAAQAAKPFTIVIGYTPGSTYDLYARVMAKHIGQYLPGSPPVVPQNMPGAGSLKVANYLYNIAPKDGSAIGIFGRGLAVQPLLDNQGIQFEARKFNWIGSPASEVSVVFSWHTTPFKTLDDVRRKEMVLPATGSGADSIVFPYVLNGVLGTRFKIVTGYPGGPELQLAVERGEADGIASTSWTNLVANRPDWIRDKKINLLLQLGTRRHPDLPDVPFVMDMAASSADRGVLQLVFARQSMAYPFVAPPGLAPDKVAQLRAAFDAVMKDPAFIAECRQMRLDVDPVSGADIAALIERVYASPPDVVARAKALVEGGGK